MPRAQSIGARAVGRVINVTSETKADRLLMYIGGEWIDSASGETFERISPVTGEVLASLPKANREDAQAAIDAANRARSHIASMPVFERAALCHAIADVLDSKHKSMGEELSLEQGKTYREACDEILFAGFAVGLSLFEGQFLAHGFVLGLKDICNGVAQCGPLEYRYRGHMRSGSVRRIDGGLSIMSIGLW